MKFGQLIEYNMKIFFFKNNAENDAGRLVPEKAFYEEKASGQHLNFNTFLVVLDLDNENKMYQTSDC